MFYIFLHEDAKIVSEKLNLKLTHLNNNILKCGFPISSLTKYTGLLNDFEINYQIVDGNLITSKSKYIENENIQNYLEQIKKLDINKTTPLKALELISTLQNLLRRNIMKRLDNLYENIYKIENIMQAFDEVCMNTKNKRRVNQYKEFKCLYICRIHNILKNREYVVGPYNIFSIYEPKKRRIVSQNMQDKIINHLVSRYILHPALLPCLINANVASRENLGTSKGLELFYTFHKKCKIKYGTYYVLKCDVSNFFASINHDILKSKLSKKIKDREALKIVFDIIDSDSQGLSIGNMTSQVLAIFYLNDLDHFIKEELKIKYFVRYQDDFLLFHNSKSYLNYCFEQIKTFLDKENLKLNPKSRLYKSTNNFIFLGRNKKGKYTKYRNIKIKLKKRLYLYNNNKISLNSLTSSIISFKNLNKRI